jgi:hypothetical protein
MSQGGQILGSIPYPSQSQIEQSSIMSPSTHTQDNNQQAFDGETTKDQYNFTFFKERNEPTVTEEEDRKESPAPPKLFKVSRPNNNGFNFLNTSIEKS